MKARSLPVLVLFLFAAWHTQAIPAENPGKAPTEVYKCSEDGKAVYQDGLCASGPSKPLKTHDAKGIEAVKGRAPEYVPPGRAPVAIIPYTPLKPMHNSQPSRGVNSGENRVGTTTCRTASGTTYAC
ncbi:MAG: hypothetical protein IT529_13810 [Burkholderiales bacterium]|nr:hypothetical protein [Burkholderiales bacterium]